MSFVPVNPPLRIVRTYGPAGPGTVVPATGPSERYLYDRYPYGEVTPDKGLVPADEFAANPALRRDLGATFQQGRDSATDQRSLVGRGWWRDRDAGTDMRNYRR